VATRAHERQDGVGLRDLAQPTSDNVMSQLHYVLPAAES
jgi:hypothetical protein